MENVRIPIVRTKLVKEYDMNFYNDKVFGIEGADEIFEKLIGGSTVEKVALICLDSNNKVINAAITNFKIIIDFDLTTPPLPNTKFTIYIVDVVNSVAASIMSVLQLAALPFTIEGGTNLSIAAPIITHNNTSSIGLASTIALEQYGTNITFNYILDSATDDRLIVSSLVGASIF